MREAVLGIDIGTSGCKTIAMDREGNILASSLQEYPLYQPKPGWAEQEPEDWWQAAAAAVRAMMPKLDGVQVAGVSFSGQMHGMVALDKDSRVVRRAILWNDQRTQSQCDFITREAGGLPGLLGYTNNMMLTGYTGGKILWMKENEPENYERTRVVVNPKDYIRLRLTGETVTEVSDASGTGLFDVKNRRWAEALIEKIGLRREIFPPCVESTVQTGRVSRQAAEETGLPEGTPVFGGGGDAVISITGMGMAMPGRVGITLGTSGVVATCLPGYAENPGGCLQLFCNNTPDRWVAFGCTLSAAGSYQWFRNAFAPGESYAVLDAEAESVPAGSGGLLFLPYLGGERCPLFDSAATGAFLGANSLMKRPHFTRAVLEGVSFSMRHVYDMIVNASPGLAPREIVIAGGGAKGKLWRQIMADVFAMPVHTVYGGAEGGAFGAALVAGMGCGLWPTVEAAMALAKSESETRPREANLPTYAAQYQKYIRMYDALKWSYE